MRRALVGLLVAWLLFLGGRAAYLALLPPETHVRRRLERMAEGFNETRLSAALSGIAPEFRAEPESIDREALADGLRALFFRAVDRETKRFAYRVELPPDEVEVEIDADDEDRAQVELLARFFDARIGDEAPAWEVRLEGAMERDSDDGWQFVTGRHETVGGERLR